MDYYDKYKQEVMRLYLKVSKMTGFSAEELSENCLVVEKTGRYAGRIGILEKQFREGGDETFCVRFKPKGRLKRFRFKHELGDYSGINKKIYFSPNIFLILEEEKATIKQQIQLPI